jgi:hypothetical protein
MDPELTQITDALRTVESDMFDLRLDQERLDHRNLKLENRRESLVLQLNLKKQAAGAAKR